MTTTPDKAATKARATAAANGPAQPPAGAKLPMDHQPAKEDVTGPKDVTVEWRGHDYLIPGEALDDLELIEAFTDQNYVIALRRLLGDGYTAYKEHARNEKGRVLASTSAEFLEHCLAEVKRGNS
jgi:hypothetical protein